MENLFKKLNAEKITQYQAHLKDSGLSEATIRRRASSLQRFLNWAADKEHLEKEEPKADLPLREKLSRPAFRLIKISGGIAIIILLVLLLSRRSLPQILYRFLNPKEITTITTPVVATYSPWIVNFRGQLATLEDEPITEKAQVVFKIYDQPENETPLWESKVWQLTPDPEGKFQASLGDTAQGDHELPSELFFQNERLYLGINVNYSPEISPRIPISTAAHVTDSYNLEGFPPSQAPTGNMVPVLTPEGHLLLAAVSPKIKSTSGTLAFEGQAITVATSPGTNGNITLAPDGAGKINLILSTGSGAAIKATDANLGTSGIQGENTLYFGQVTNDNKNYNLLKLESGSTPTPKFIVDADGNTTIKGDLLVGQNELKVDTSNSRVGVGTTAPDYLLDVAGSARVSEVIYNLYNKALKQGNEATITANGWYRVAQTPGRASGLFQLMDMTTDRQQSVYFYASTAYPDNSNQRQLNINLLANVRHNQNTFSNVRFVHKSDSDPIYLEVYIENANNNTLRYILSQNDWDDGWSPVDWSTGEVPSGYATTEYSVSTLIFATGENALTVNDEGRVGVGTAGPAYKLDVAGDIGLSENLYLTDDNWLGIGAAEERIVFDTAGDIAFLGANVGIGNTSPSEELDVSGDATISGTLSLAPQVQAYAGTCNASSEGKMYYDAAQNEYYFCDGSSWTAISSGTGSIDGSGTANYLPKWLDSDTLTDSVIYESSGSLGIGTTAPTATLDVSGSLTASGTITFSGLSTNGPIYVSSGVLNSEQYLATSRGGLGNNVTAAGAGEVLYSTSTTAYDSLVAGSSNQLLTSGGAGAPSWQDIVSLLTAGNDIDITGTTNATIAVEDDIDATYLRASSASGLYLYDDGSNLGIFIEDGGNVGIGKTGPGATLDISGDLKIGTVNNVADNSQVLTVDSGVVKYIDTSSWDKDTSDDFGAWFLAGDSGTDQSIGAGETASILGGVGIGTTVSATDTLTVSVDESYGFAWSGNQSWAGSADFNGDVSIADTDITLDGASTNLNLTGDFSINTNDFFVEKSSGNIGIGTTGPSEELDITGSATLSGTLALSPQTQAFAGTCNASSEGKMYYDSTQNKYYYCDGSSWTPVGTGTGVGGSGTANYLPKWSSSSALTDSIIYESSSQIGIGTTNPGAKLDIVGDLKIGTVNSVADNNQVLTVDSGIVKYIDTSSWDKNSADDYGAWWLAGDSGTTQNIGAGNTASIIGGVGIGTTASATDTLTIGVDETYGFNWSGTHSYSASDINYTNTTSTTLDTAGDLHLDADGGDILFGDNGSWFGGWNAGNLGIGTTGPSEELEVAGDLLVTGHAAFGANGAVATDRIIDIDEILTADATQYGMVLEPTFNFTAGASRNLFGLWIETEANDTVEGAYHIDITGIRSRALVTNGSTANDLYSGYFVATAQNSTGLVDKSYGIYAESISAGNISTARGVYGHAWENGGTITTGYGGQFLCEDATTCYGLRADATDTDPATNYGLWIEGSGATTNNYGIWVDAGDIVLDADGDGIAGGTGGGGDIVLGEGQDLELYHDGTNSYINNNTGDLIIDSSADVALQSTSGNVGIGNTDPGAKLDISGDLKIGTVNSVADNSQVLTVDSGIVKYIDTSSWDKDSSDDFGGWILTGDSGTAQSIGTGDTASILGGVGIGTTVGATDTLTVSVDESYGFNWSGTHSYSAADINFTNATSTTLDTTGDLHLDADGGDILFGDNGSWFGGWNAGNLGIGTTGPGTKLDVNGDISLETYLYIRGGGGTTPRLRIYSTGGVNFISNYYWNYLAFLDRTSGEIARYDSNGWYFTGGNVGIGTISPDALLDVEGTTWLRGASADQGLYVDSSGNVGIGTTDPGAKLDISGDLKIGTVNSVADNNQVLTVDSGIVKYIDTSSWDKDTSDEFGAWFLTGDSGTAQSIGSGNTATFAGGVGIGTTVGATDTLTVSVDESYGFNWSGTHSYSAADINFTNATSTTLDTTGDLHLDADGGDILFGDNGSWFGGWKAGNLGIGTTGPGVKLDIKSAGTSSFGLRLIKSNSSNSIAGFYETSGGHGALYLYDSAGVARAILNAGASLGMYNSSGTLTTSLSNSGNSFLNAGNLGIGTTGPSALVHLSSTGVLDLLRIDDNGPGDNSPFIIDQNGNVGIGTVSPDAKLDVEGTAWLRGASADQGLYVDSSGNVGVGTTGPTNKLDVAGTAEMTGFKMTTSPSAGYVLTSDASGVGTWTDVSSSAGPWTLTDDDLYPDSTSYNVAIGAIDAGSAKLYVSGNMGIGTTAPSEKLEVVGDVALSGALSAGDSTPDGHAWHVFGTGEKDEADITDAEDVYISGDLEIDGTLYAANIAGDVEGSGTQNYIPKWSSSDTLTDSLLYDDGTNVGIGTTSPGQLLELSKSSGDPAIVFDIGETDKFILGVDDSASDIFKIETGDSLVSGTPPFAIDSNGNVGIGTTNPQYGKLQLDGNGGYSSGIILYSGAGGSMASSYLKSDSGSDYNWHLTRAGNDTKGIIIDKDGEVGIGTASPGSLLSLGSSTANTKLALFDNGSSFYGMGIQANDFRFHVYSSSADFNFYDAPAGNSLMTIKGTGNVGIGTQSPNTLLDVEGTAWLRGASADQGLYVDSNGNVGIGTTGPNSKLEVAGDIALGANKVLWGTSGSEDVNLYKSSTNTLKTDDKLVVSGNLDVGTGDSSNALFIVRYNTAGDGKYTGVVAPLTGGAGISLFYHESGVGYHEGLRVEGGTGNVGIGNTDPGAKLDISGDLKIGTVNSVADNSQVLTVDSGIVKYIDTSSWDKDTSDEFGAWFLTGDSGTAQSIGSGNTATFTGGVGIGTTVSATDTLTIDVDQSYNFAWTGLQTWSQTATFNGSIDLNNILDLDANDASNYAANIAQTGNGGGLYVSNTGSGTSFRVDDEASDLSPFIIDASGNVGIGTTGPGYKVHMERSSADATLYVKNLRGSGGEETIQADTAQTNTSGYLGGHEASPYTNNWYGVRGTTQGGIAVIGRVINASGEAARFLGGSVGIGSSSFSPGAHMLDIESIKGSTGQSAIRAQYLNSGIGGQEFGAIAHREGQWNAIYGKQGSGGAALYTDGEVNLMGGNVGIGTTNPGAKLDIVGDLKIGTVNNVADNNQVLTVDSGIVKYIDTSSWDKDSSNDAWFLAGDSGTAQNIGAGNTASILGGVGIGTTASATDTLTITVDETYGFSWSGTHGYSASDINLTNATSTTLDTTGDLHLDADGGDILFGDNGSWFGGWNAGNVGIGTTAPSEDLHIKRTAAGQDAVILIDASGSGGVDSRLNLTSTTYIKYNTWTANLDLLNSHGGAAPTFGNITFSTRSTERLRITGVGNVGIGTQSPDALFDVEGTAWLRGASADQGLYVDSSGNVGVGMTAPSEVLEVSGNIAADKLVDTADSSYYVDPAASGTSIYVNGDVAIGMTANNDDDYLYFDTGTDESFYWDDDPGQFVITDDFVPNADDSLDLGSNTARWQDLYLGPGTIHIGTSTSDEYAIGYDTTNNRLEFNANGSGPAELVMDSGGNVGIGTTSPGTSLLYLYRAGADARLSIESGTGYEPKIRFYAYDASHDGEIGINKDNSNLYLGRTLTNEGIINIDLTNERVGIGTTGPTAELDVAGDISVGIEDTSEKAVIIHGGGTGDHEGGQIQLEMAADYDGTYNEWIVDVYDDDLRFFTTAGGVELSIDPTGTITGTDFECTNCIDTGELKTDTGTEANTNSAGIIMNDFTFFPSHEIDDCSGATISFMRMVGSNYANNTIGRFYQKMDSACTSGSYDTHWRYVTASDHPTIWVIANADGLLRGVWQGGDPVNQFNYPENPNPYEGTELEEGQRIVSVEPLTINQLDSFYNSLPPEEKAQILADLKEYLVDKRGWLKSFKAITDLAQISDRYQLSGRFWAMRFLAQHYEISPSELILELMVVPNDQLILKPNIYQALLTHLEQRQLRIEENTRIAQELANSPTNQQNADLSEWYSSQPEAETPQPGEIISIGSFGFIAKSLKAYDQRLIGIISTHPGQTLGVKETNEDVKIALAGRVPTQVSNLNGSISPGDPITSSTIPGVGMKATQAGPIVGKALEAFDENQGEPCPQEPQESEYQCGQILVFVNLGWHDPDVYLTDTGELNIQKEEGEYVLKDSNGNFVERVGAFTEVIMAELQAGLIEAQEIVTEKLSSREVNTQKLITPLVESQKIDTERISLREIDAKPGEDIILDLGNQGASESGFSKLIIKGENGEIVASIDASGSAEFERVEAEEIHAKKVVAEEIVGLESRFGELIAATVSAQTIQGLKERLAQLEGTPEPPPEEEPSATDSDEFLSDEEIEELVNQILGTSLEATPQTELSEIYGDNLSISENLTVLGTTSLADTTIAGSLSLDGTMTLADNSINSLTGPLYLQSLGLGGLDILAGKITIDEQGNAVFGSDVTIKGRLALSEIEPLIDGEKQDLTVDLSVEPTEPEGESQFGKLLVKGVDDEVVVAIEASGTATFKKLAIAKAEEETTQASATEIETNATAGKAVLPADETEITIKSPFVTENTLIYITPVSDSQNKVLFVAAKKAHSEEEIGWFKVAIDAPISIEVKFNWWIIN